jgi:hypothetical protein
MFSSFKLKRSLWSGKLKKNNLDNYFLPFGEFKLCSGQAPKGPRVCILLNLSRKDINYTLLIFQEETLTTLY